MQIIKLFIGVFVLFLGIPVGNILAKFTKEELNAGQKWFKLIIVLSLIIGFVGLLLKNDFLMFSLFFIALVTSKSIKYKKNTS